MDALRLGLAAVVMLDHTAGLSQNQGLPHLSDISILNKSTEAVYAFFVLSGYLIIRSIYIEKKNETFSIRNFYARRALRILPLYYFVGLLGLLFYHLFLPQLNTVFDNRYTLTEGVFMIIAMVPNVLFTYEPGGILEVLWSIGIEEQFYLSIALLLMITRTEHLLKALIFIFVVSFLLFHNQSLSFFKDYGLVYFFLIFGGITAICHEKGFFNFFMKKKLLQITLLALILILFFTDFLKSESSIVYHLTLTVIFSMFILMISNVKQPFIVKSNIINYLGRISYGIYMLHTIVLNFVVFVFLKFTFESDALVILLINVLTISITFLVSHFSYKYFESYFLKKKNNFRTIVK